MGQNLSPAVVRKTVSLATKLPSFRSAQESVAETLELKLTVKHVERLAERHGERRVAERAAEIAAWERLRLMEKLAAPEGVQPPAVVCVSTDGGRLQRCDLPEESASSWCETKAGVVLELEPQFHESDPCPEVPDKFLDLVRVERLTREIKAAVPPGEVFQAADSETPADDPASAEPVCDREEVVAPSPEILRREVVASLADSTTFGRHLAARAWAVGCAVAPLKAFVADGQAANWGIWERHFKHLEFVPILDFIHALTYIYSAACAGRPRADAAAVYTRWITWVWQGQVAQVIVELAERAAELGLPPESVPETDPRRLVARTLTYLVNQQSRMRYAEYRRLGLPITSSPMESTIKQLNYRMKGSEKFWTAAGAEALLQLRADQLSDSAPLNHYWTRRPALATGTRNYRKAA